MSLRESFDQMLDTTVPIETSVAQQIESDKKILNLAQLKLYKIDDLQSACLDNKRFGNRHAVYTDVAKELSKQPLPITGEDFWKIVYSVLYKYELAENRNIKRKKVA